MVTGQPIYPADRHPRSACCIIAAVADVDCWGRRTIPRALAALPRSTSQSDVSSPMNFPLVQTVFDAFQATATPFWSNSAPTYAPNRYQTLPTPSLQRQGLRSSLLIMRILAPPLTQVELPIRILTHNIRYAATSLERNERPWHERLPLIVSELSYNTQFLTGSTPNNESIFPEPSAQTAAGAAFICLQEVLHGQLVDILAGLNDQDISKDSSSPSAGPIWAHIGIAREDGLEKGEYSPILYPVRVFSLLHFENIWLSSTPHEPSKGWDAGSPRILTVGVFEHRITRQRIMACCTHLDNQGGEARKQSVRLILETIERIRNQWITAICAPDGKLEDRSGEMGVFLAGDFNSLPEQEAYLEMAHSDLMCDLREHVESKNRRYGEDITFTGFNRDQDPEDQGRIDFIWLGPKETVVDRDGLYEVVVPNPALARRGLWWEVRGYAVLPNVFEEGIYSSDHRAVVGDVCLHG